MSHFLLAVLHYEDQDVEEMLAPYSEELKVAPYVIYTRAEAITYAREHYSDCRDMSDAECLEFMADGYTTDEQGNIYSTYNPKSKWDWYEVGGRWNGYLRTKNGKVNEARISEIDFSPDEEEFKTALRFWDVVIDHAPALPDEKFFSIYNEQYYRDFYGDRETFARVRADFTTHAVITPNGFWHERGSMGWFGMSSETPEEGLDWYEHYLERFIKDADPALIVTVVDCRI